MEYRLVPTIKENGQKLKKHEASDRNGKNSKTPEVLEGKMYSPQPIFKPPKSTREVDVSDTWGKDDASIKKVAENNKCNDNLNHFTMSRPGVLKKTETANGKTDDTKMHVKYTNGTSQIFSYLNGKRKGSEGSVKNIKFADQDSRLLRVEQARRRASAGDERLSANSSPTARKGGSNAARPGNGSSGFKSQGGSPKPVGQRNHPCGYSNGKENATQHKHVTFDVEAPRRKSLYEGRATQPWHSPDKRPVSSDRCERPRRNVISPTTLSRFSSNQEEIVERGGSTNIRVCTEDDWKEYGSNLPNRKLVSHKKLNHKNVLPYSDNIGLEETVTSDQARKVAKMKDYKEWKKQYKPRLPNKSGIEPCAVFLQQTTCITKFRGEIQSAISNLENNVSCCISIP